MKQSSEHVDKVIADWRAWRKRRWFILAAAIGTLELAFWVATAHWWF